MTVTRWSLRAWSAFGSTTSRAVSSCAGGWSPLAGPTMRTARLVVLPKADQARSDHRVTVTQGASILAGTGLRADLATKRFELLDQVKGRYVPR